MTEVPKGLCFWDPLERKLHGKQIYKARKFVGDDLVEELSSGKYLVHPIDGYNKTTYQVDWIQNSLFYSDCNCQYRTRYGKPCSHILAVNLFNMMKKELKSK